MKFIFDAGIPASQPGCSLATRPSVPCINTTFCLRDTTSFYSSPCKTYSDSVLSQEAHSLVSDPLADLFCSLSSLKWQFFLPPLCPGKKVHGWHMWLGCEFLGTVAWAVYGIHLRGQLSRWPLSLDCFFVGTGQKGESMYGVVGSTVESSGRLESLSWTMIYHQLFIERQQPRPWLGRELLWIS